jgi:hypothetical protein
VIKKRCRDLAASVALGKENRRTVKQSKRRIDREEENGR